MVMTPEIATTLMNHFAADAEREAATTRRVLAAVPAETCDYKPSDKCMSGIDLAWHIASAEVFFLDGVVKGAFEPGGGKRPENVKTPAQVVEWYDANIGAALEKVKGLSGDHLAKSVDFFGMFNSPAVLYLNLCIKHSVHHRGQLSAYLRPMGAKVPSIYGPSADEGIAAAG
jgi:uncharacterized damage-inducible protein DinB